jgi:hypothetical protein
MVIIIIIIIIIIITCRREGAGMVAWEGESECPTWLGSKKRSVSGTKELNERRYAHSSTAARR